MLLLITIPLLLSGAYCEKLPLVETPLGQVRGYHKTSHDGRKFSVFEGIPYAKPPIGDLRFEEPVAADPWYGIWNASFPTTCLQNSMLTLNITAGVEDCLHINVYVPRDNPDPSERLDVIVHIHGGSYLYCSGHYYAKPTFLMDRDIILVTFNYRLGIMGFLSTEDEVVPGNNGLKDQVMALKWVQQNIASFGGNPESVTINGLSAGGSSVHLHYFSPLSRGLFQKGFAQSGFALNPWSIQEKPLIKTQKLADAVGCPTSDTKLMVDCLKQRPYNQIFHKMPLFFSYKFLPIAPFGPVVEKGGSKPFLDQNPYVLLKKGQVNDVPFLGSVTTHEGLFILTYLSDSVAELGNNWKTLAPDMLEFNNTVPSSSWLKISEKIKEFYFGEDNINDNHMKLAQVFTDRLFHNGAETSVIMQAKVNKCPVYFFLFGYPGDNSEKSVTHAGDTKYYFTDVFSHLPLSPNEIKMKDMVLDMMVSFAKTGKPVLGEVDWKPTSGDRLTFVRIKGVEPGEITQETVDNLAPRSFWDSLEFEEGENLIS